MPFKSFTWSLYRSKAMWRLMAESPAWSAGKMHMFSTEFGWGHCRSGRTSWKILHLCLHLSSPRFHLGESCHHAMSACFSLKYIDVGWYLQNLPIFFTSHFAPGAGTPSHQDLAHSTEQLGAFPPQLASMEKRKGEPLKPGLYPPPLVPTSSSSSHFQSSLLNLLIF